MNQFEEAEYWKKLDAKTDRELAEEHVFLDKKKLQELQRIRKSVTVLVLITIVSAIYCLLVFVNAKPEVAI